MRAPSNKPPCPCNASAMYNIDSAQIYKKFNLEDYFGLYISAMCYNNIMGLRRWFKENFEVVRSDRPWNDFILRGGILTSKAETEISPSE